jgi:hypothetical protein
MHFRMRVVQSGLFFWFLQHVILANAGIQFACTPQALALLPISQQVSPKIGSPRARLLQKPPQL